MCLSMISYSVKHITIKGFAMYFTYLVVYFAHVKAHIVLFTAIFPVQNINIFFFTLILYRYYTVYT